MELANPGWGERPSVADARAHPWLEETLNVLEHKKMKQQKKKNASTISTSSSFGTQTIQKKNIKTGLIKTGSIGRKRYEDNEQ